MKKVFGILVVVLVIGFYITFLRFKEVGFIEMDGYLLKNNQITTNLYQDNNEERKQVETTKVEEMDKVYQQGDKLYVGKNKKEEITTSYPLISKDGSRILNFSSTGKFIQLDYEQVDAFPNTIIASGNLYHTSDYLKVDEEKYSFVLLEENLLMNTLPIKVITETEERQIPIYSIIYFQEDEIRYYEFKDEAWTYKEITGVDEATLIEIEKTQTSYEDFLDLIQIKEKQEIPEEEIEVPENNQNQEEVTPPSSEEGTEQTYVRPEVALTNINTNVYSLQAHLEITDQNDRITKSPTIEIYQNGSLFLRKTYYGSGDIEIVGLLPDTEFTIVGTYDYLNEENKQIRRTFINETIHTKDMSTLEPIQLTYQNGEIYAKKIVLEEFGFLNDSNSEALKGIKKITVKVGDNEFQVSSSNINRMKRLEKITYETGESLESNQTYQGTITIYDQAGNKMKVENASFETRTSKQAPTVNVKVEETDITRFTLGVEVENKDDIVLNRFRYEIYDENSKIVQEGEIQDKKINGENLNTNIIYTVRIYADYDLEDGRGTRENELLKETKVSTNPLSSLGFIRVTFEEASITEDSAKYRLYLNIDNTDKRLVELLDQVTIVTRKQETGEEVSRTTFGTEEVNKLKTGTFQDVIIENLESKTNYEIEVTTKIRQGDISYDITTLSNLKEFMTKKKEAKVEIINQFTMEDFIDFDVRIEDSDLSIESDRVILEVRNKNTEALVLMKDIKINSDYERITLEKLEKETPYVFRYIAEEYNTGYTNSSYEESKVLLEKEVITEVGIHGEVILDSLLPQITSRNLIDIGNRDKWRRHGQTATDSIEIDEENNLIYMSYQNTTIGNYWIYSYYLPEYRNQEVTISFQVKYQDNSEKGMIRILNHYTAANYISDIPIELGEDWITFTKTVTLNDSGYIGFFLQNQTTDNTPISIMIKDFQVELGNTQTEYQDYSEKEDYQATFQVDLTDTKQEIVTNDFYIRLYENDQKISDTKYDLENYQIEDFEILKELSKNKEYKVELTVKIRDRFYTIDTLTFNSNDEIRSIHDIDDFFKIHTRGTYLVVEDLDIRNDSRTLTTSLGDEYFNIILDFQGHQLLMDNRRNELFYPGLGPEGKLLNLDLHWYVTNPNKVLYINGIVNTNMGLMSNIKITLEEAIEIPAVTQFSLLCGNNNGIIENFIVHTKDSIHVSDDFGLVTRSTYRGTIRNGYLYGEKIIASYQNTRSGQKFVGAVVGNMTQGSVLENVYSLIDIDAYSLEHSDSNDRVGNLVGFSQRSTVRNVYSVAEGENRDLNTDPNLGIIDNAQATNSFYINNSIYNTSYSLKTSKTALWNTTFQDKVLNSSTSQFNVNDFVSYGYYPQLIMNEDMPAQEYIPLPELKDEDLIDIISVGNVDQQGSKATATLTVHNPANEKITDISIKDLTTKIISQQDNNGTTTLVIEVSNPVRYVSQYFIKSITSRNSFNLPYTREFEDNERVLQIELFKEISTVDEWLEIKNSLSENYKLTADLDFQNRINPNLGNFSGVLDGNNHTISNITSTTGHGVIIGQLSGTVRNLYAENISKTNTGTHNGLIGYTSNSQSAVIENVHVSDVELVISLNVGGIIGSAAYGTNIINCSVTDIRLLDVSTSNTNLHIGGLVGYLDNGIVENSYVQGLDFETNYSSIQGIGGLVGQTSNSTIQNSYVSGKIKANSQNVGGIVGYVTTSTNLSSVYSNVNIHTTQGNVGGIIGQLVSTSSQVTNTLVVGDIYSRSSSENVRRTVGNRDINQNNYVWQNQHMNGVITSETNGETLLSTEQLNDPFTYQNFIQLGSVFSYQNLDTNQLPYLYYKDTTELLPNQKANYLNEYEFEVTEIEVSPSIDSAYIMIRLQNEDNLPVSNVKIDGLTITEIRKNVTENGVTTLELMVKPDKAYDSYKLQEITYQKDGAERSYDTAVKINLQFYKDIESFEDWQKISTTDPENYRLIADIDFSNKVNVNTGVVFNRLEGTDGGHTLKNLEITSTKAQLSFIKQIDTSVSNVIFDNIKVSTTASGNYASIIQYTYGSMENLTFQNITVDASKTTYVGSISRSYSTSIQNIQLNNITVVGNSNVAGFIGLMDEADVENITLKTVNVMGNSNNVAGLIGNITNSISTKAKQFNIKADDVHVISTASSNHGILYGSGGCSNSTIKNSSVHGYNNVGGMAGSNNVYEGSKVSVENCDISGNQYVGGISGTSGRIIDSSIVSNSTISGNNSSSLYVGGLAGYYANEIRNSGIYHSTITNLGDYTGGLVGRATSVNIYRNAVQDCVVSGNNYVGGVNGGNSETSHPRTIRYNTIQATINATGSGAGGIMGYYQNNNIDTTLGQYTIHSNLIENSSISAGYNAGGLIGQVDAMKTGNVIYNNIIVANVETVNDPSSAGIVIGNGDALTTAMQNTLIYENSQLNGEIISDLDIVGIEEKNYGSASDLATQTTYTNRGLTTGEFDFSPLSTGHYPILINTLGQELISLPISTFQLSTMSLAYPMNYMKSLPQVVAYSSGINVINLEFSELNEYVTVYVNDTPYSLTDKTMTFYYDYQTDLKIVVTDGLNAKEYIFTPDDVKKTILTIGNYYYYLDNDKLISNEKEYNDSFIHLYDHYALTSDGGVLDLETGVYQENNITNLSRKQNTTSLYRFTYHNQLIDTYYGYSLIDQEKEVDNQVFIKNGKVTMLRSDSMYYGDQIIIDSYNNKDYLLVLGSDGKLYSLKSEIKYPNDFKNKEIIEMSSNILGNSSFVLVRYEDGSIYGFDYRTGVRIVSTVDKNVSIIDYFVDKVRSAYQETFDTSYQNAYQDTQKLVTKLEEQSLEQVMDSKEQDTYEYVEVYDPVKKKYDVYEVSSYLNGSSRVENMTIDYDKSITDNIYQDYALYSYYHTSLPGRVIGTKLNGLYIFIGICTLIGSLFVLLLTYRQKENTAK